MMHPSSYSIAKRIFREYLSKYTKQVYLSIVFMTLFAFASSLQVWLVKPALDEVFVSRNAKVLWLIPLACMLVALLKSVADYYQSYLLKFIGQRITNDIQLDLYKHLLHADLKFINQQSSGKLMSKFMNDITNLKNSVASVVVNVIKDSLTVIGLVCVMFYNDVNLALITFVAFPIAVLPVVRMSKKMKGITHDTQEELASYTAKLDENFKNIKIIKAFNAEADEIGETTKYLNRILEHYKRGIRVEALASPTIELLGAAAASGTILYGGHQVLNGSLTAGSFLSFIVAFVTAYKPIKSLASLNITMQTGISSAARIFDTLDTKQSVDGLETLKLKQAPTIEFRNLGFKHEDRERTLHNVSFTIEPGQFIAIVGASGSGKSTLIDLLFKFYLPHQGGIYIDGQDLSKFTSESIRHHFALANQDVMLFDRSVKDNIRYSNPQATDAEIKAMAELSTADEFIKRLPDKYDSRVGQFGTRLSGGQKQKIAIARSMLKDSFVFALDEATASLDQASERTIKKALKALQFNKTIIMVTHRLSMLTDVDMIYVLKDGSLYESGTHSDLMRKKDEYYRLSTQTLKVNT